MKETKIDYYQKFRNSCLDTSAVGLTVGSEFSYYGATPDHSRVIAWAEIFGIHFCRKEDGETIYVVEPDAQKDKAVYPIAANFLEFMGLVVACNHASVLWQAQDLSRREFDDLLLKNKPSMKQRSVLRAIGNIYHPPVISDPYGYMKNLRK
jgi:hypothetical protein